MATRDVFLLPVLTLRASMTSSLHFFFSNSSLIIAVPEEGSEVQKENNSYTWKALMFLSDYVMYLLCNSVSWMRYKKEINSVV